MIKLLPRRQRPTRSEEYVIDEIFPVHEVNFIAGASGAGKTTWLFQTIDRWSRGENICGYPSYPKPFAYISFDRSGEGYYRASERLQLKTDNWNILIPEGAEHTGTITLFLQKVKKAYPEIKVYFIEALAGMVPGGKISDYTTVKQFMVNIREFCVKHDVTVIATMHAAKTKEGETYLDPRQRLIGSVAFAGFSEGIIFLEQTNLKDQSSPLRSVTFLPRNAKPKVIKMTFDEQGVLVPLEELTKQEITILEYARTLSEPFTPKQAMLATNYHASGIKATLKRLTERGRLIHNPEHGTYSLGAFDSLAPNPI